MMRETFTILNEELSNLSKEDQENVIKLLGLTLREEVIYSGLTPLHFQIQYTVTQDRVNTGEMRRQKVRADFIENEIRKNTFDFEKIKKYVKRTLPLGTATLTAAVNPINISTLMQTAGVQKLYIKKNGKEWQEASASNKNVSGANRIRIGVGDIISFMNPIKTTATKNENQNENEQSVETRSGDYVVINMTENLRDSNSGVKIRVARSGERFKILGNAPSSGKYQYKLVESETGEQFRLCINDGENVRIQTVKSIRDEAFMNSPEELTEKIEKQTTFGSYERSLNPEMDISKCKTITNFASPPRGYIIEKSDNPNSFQSYLENYPIGEGDLKYDKKTVDFLKKEMSSVEQMNEVMEQIRSALWATIKAGTFDTERVGKKYLGNNFSNNELSAMVAGWMAGVDIREVNYFKTISTEGKLNLHTFAHQDCVDSCLRLNIEYLITQGDYKSIQKLGCHITSQMSTEQIDKQLLKFFQTTNTRQFSRKHHELGDNLNDKQIDEMVEDGFEMNVGDYITFNDSKNGGGHTVLVMAKAKNNDGESVYRIATGTLPATDMALYKGWVSIQDLLGGGDITNFLTSVPILGGVVKFFMDTGIKADKNGSGWENTISIGNLNGDPKLLTNKNT